MSHRKVHSQGNVPFSWEDKPGISKITHLECPTDKGLNTLILPPQPKSSPRHSESSLMLRHGKKIPLPPCPFLPPTRSSSRKVIWGQEDPFLAALKECSKSVRSHKMPGESKNGVESKVRKSKFIFLCKDSCDVENDNLVKFANLPRLPKQRYGVFN